MKVRCIDARRSILKHGQTYEAEYEDRGLYALKEFPGEGAVFFKNRFMEVKSSDTLPPPTFTAPTGAYRVRLDGTVESVSVSADKEEERLRNALRFRACENECNRCGAPLPCKYH